MKTLEVGARLSLKNILLATDFSPCSDAALPYARLLARRYRAKVYVAHVVPPEPWPVIPHDSLPLAMDQSFGYAERHMADFLRTDPLADVPHEVLLTRGQLWEVLADVIEKHEIDLLVLGTHGRHGLKKLLLGSVAEEVFRQARCPVLTVGPKLAPHALSDGGLKHILYATDFSEGSLRAMRYALSLTEENRARLTLLHVLPEMMPGVLLETPNIAPEYPDRLAEHAEERLKKLLPMDSELWGYAEFVVQLGMPAETILKLAAERNVDLIVMGVRHKAPTLASTHFPWATAHKVVSQALCPVLTVRG